MTMSPWFEFEEKRLRSLINQGKSMMEIADTMGRTEKSCYQKASYMGLYGNSVPKKPKIREAAIVNYGKHSAAEIGKMLGVSRDVIIGHWHRAGLHRKARR